VRDVRLLATIIQTPGFGRSEFHVDDYLVDELNNPGGGLLLNPGTYDLRISSPVFGEINQKVTIEANKVTVVPLHKK